MFILARLVLLGTFVIGLYGQAYAFQFPAPHIVSQRAVAGNVSATIEYLQGARGYQLTLSHAQLSFREEGVAYDVRSNVPKYAADARITFARLDSAARPDLIISYFTASGPGVGRFSGDGYYGNRIVASAGLHQRYHELPCVDVVDGLSLVTSSSGAQGLVEYDDPGTRVIRLHGCRRVDRTAEYVGALRYEASSIVSGASLETGWPPKPTRFYRYLADREFGDDVDALETLSTRYVKDIIAAGDSQRGWAAFLRAMAKFHVSWDHANLMVSTGAFERYALSYGSEAYYRYEVDRLERLYGKDSATLAIPYVRLERLMITRSEDYDTFQRRPISEAERFVRRAADLVIAGKYPADACPLAVLLDYDYAEERLGKPDRDERRFLAMSSMLESRRGCPSDRLLPRLIVDADYRRKDGDYEQAKALLDIAITLPLPTDLKHFFGEGDLHDPFSELAEVYRIEGRYEDAAALLIKRFSVAPKTEQPLLRAQFYQIAAYDLPGDRGLDLANGIRAIDGTKSADLDPYDALTYAREIVLLRREALQHGWQGAPPGLQTIAAGDDDLLAYGYAIRALEGDEDDQKLWDAEDVPIRIEAATDFCSRHHYDSALTLLSAARNAPELTPVDRAGIDLAYAECMWGKNGNGAQVLALLTKVVSTLFDSSDHAFNFMSEPDRLSYMSARRNIIDLVYSFAVEHRSDAEARRLMLDVALSQKAIVAGGMSRTRAVLERNADAQTSEVLERLSREQNALDAARLGTEKQDPKFIRTLASEVDRLQGFLLRKAALGGLSATRPVTSGEVAARLGPAEAAVEVVRYRVYNGLGPTDAAAYAAIIVDGKNDPRVIPLGDAATLEPTVLHAYARVVSPSFSGVQGPQLYDAAWRAIGNALQNARRVDFSPDGIYDKIAPDVIKGPDGQYLNDRYDLRVMTSTRTLAQPEPQFTSRDAVFFGNPTFRLTADAQRLALQTSMASPPAVYLADAIPGAPGVSGSRGLRRGDPIADLPGTAIEVQAIASNLRSSGWSADDSFTGTRALEELVKVVHGPRVLHIATHGFFFPAGDVGTGSAAARISAIDDPMMRSGLLFAGAERAWVHGETTPGLEDGILTAKEATLLDLTGTELVVLSACDTGLGDIEGGEGVFGLRRAFQEAGARNLLMTMWSIEDDHSSRLMQRFYAHWIGGQEELHQALRDAEHDLRDDVIRETGRDLPYLWGSFVLAS